MSEIYFPDFVLFYDAVEDIVTATLEIDLKVLDLYDTILETIEDSSLLDSKGFKTWIIEIYNLGQNNSESDSNAYDLKVVAFVKDLQEITTHEYGSVDDFYALSGIIVSVLFANVSEFAGYPISPQYIEDIS